MVNPRFLNIPDIAKIMIEKNQKENEILSSNNTGSSNANKSKTDYFEKKQKEHEEHKKLIIKRLEEYNSIADSLMSLISKFLKEKDSELKEKIKVDFKGLKDRMKVEYKKLNATKYYGNIVERAFYKPAINESWAKISAIQYNRIPNEEMFSAVYDVSDYISHYLCELKTCNVMELS